MGCNVGGIDRILRIVVGVVILAIGLVMGSWWGLIGLIPLVTGLVKWCPAYLIFGLKTCKAEKTETPE